MSKLKSKYYGVPAACASSYANLPTRQEEVLVQQDAPGGRL